MTDPIIIDNETTVTRWSDVIDWSPGTPMLGGAIVQMIPNHLPVRSKQLTQEETFRRWLAAAERLGYRRSPLGQLTRGVNDQILWAWPDDQTLGVSPGCPRPPRAFSPAVTERMHTALRKYSSTFTH